MKKLAYCLSALGVVLLAIWLGLTSYQKIKTNDLIDEFRKNSTTSAELEKYKEEENKEKELFTDGMIGIIKIPSIDLKFPIMDGVDDKILKQAVGRFTESAAPGEKGNMTLTGHNNFILAEPFKSLDEVVEGDKIIIETKDKIFTYEAQKADIVLASDKGVIKKSEEFMLTLVTCTNDAKKRLAITAGFISEEDK